LYVASLLPLRPRRIGADLPAGKADCIVFAKIFWVQSPPFAKAKRGSLPAYGGEPILLRKSCPATGFSCKAIILAC